MDRLDLTAVSVRSFYGHPMPGLAALDLGPGVNVVYGPNGQGKTTLARAIHGALWPETVQDLRPSYTAEFRLGGDDWRVEFDAGTPRYRRRGEPADRVPLPDKSFRDRYELSLGDLLAADGDAFAEVVRRDAAGGVDLSAARTRLGFKAAPTLRLKASAEAEEAARAVQRRRHALDALRAREQALGEIAERAAEATDAAEIAELYRLLDAAADRAEAADAADRVVASFAGALAAVAPDTQSRYDDLAIAVRKAEMRRADVEDARADARAALAAHGWDAVDVPEEAELRARAAEADAAARALDDARRARAAAAERERRARESLGGHIDAAPTVDLDALGDMAAFARRAGQVQGRAVELEARRLAAKARYNSIRYHDADELARGAGHLRQWLAYTTEAERGAAALPPRALWIAAGAVAALAVLLGALWTPGAFWLLAAAAALAAVAVLLGRAPADLDHPAETARHAYAALSLPTPSEWSRPEIERHLAEAERQSAEQRERAMWTDAIAEIERALHAVDKEREALDAEAAHLGETLGLGAPDTPEGLHLLVRTMLAWQEAARDLGVADAALGDARDALAAALDLVNHALDGLPLAPVADAASAAGAVARVAREVAERDRLREAVARLDQSAGEATERLAEAEDARDAFLARLGLSEPAAEGVASLCAAFPAYTAAVAEAARAHTLAEEASTRARAHGRFAEDAAALDRAALAAARSAAETRAARRDEWLEEKAAIQTLVGEARRADALTVAHAEHARALDALGAAYDEQADALIGHALADFVEEETRDQHLPQVFKRAREVLADITDDRFRLDFDEGDEAFTAFDAVRGRSFGLDELSSGTRLQLLLAVRLAFAESQELGVRLPILLDEALANSDDERAGAIVEAVLRLCRQGRQVFYFTAQAEEVAKWRRLAGEHPDVECRFVGLPSAQALAAVDREAVPAGATTRPVPSPKGRGSADYADALAVPAWTGWDPIESLHVWYLLDEPEQVYACLRRGYATWGQLRAAGERRKPVPVDLRAVRLRAEAVEAWQAAWRQGRGRRLDRAALRASGAASGDALAGLAALAEDARGDAGAFLERLGAGPVAGLAERQAERLKAFLVDEGYVSPDPRLGEDEIRRRVADAVPHPDALDAALPALDRVRQRAEGLAV